MTKNNKYINREVSWLHFNERVLQEAMDVQNPIIERLKFLGIFSNNRDEFFRVRVATLKRMIQIEKQKGEKVKFNPASVLKEVRQIVEEQEKKFTNTFIELKKELKKENIIFLDENSLNEEEGKIVQQYFHTEVRPYLFPIMLKNISSPDRLRDNSIFLAVHLIDSTGQNEDDYSIIMVPTDHVPRFIQLPNENNKKHIIFAGS